jgi:N-terminal acetyltransferase B complex catalytic subunit
MYEGLGYSVYRRVRGYYSGGVRDGDEDAYGADESLALFPR